MTDRIGYRRPDASGLEDMSPLRRMVADQRSGRRDQFEQLWQALSMELSYREARLPGSLCCDRKQVGGCVQGKIDEASGSELQVR